MSKHEYVCSMHRWCEGGVYCVNHRPHIEQKPPFLIRHFCVEGKPQRSKCRREPAQHSVLPSLAGGEFCPADVICTLMDVRIACPSGPYTEKKG
jgi:hypothetical protein